MAVTQRLTVSLQELLECAAGHYGLAVSPTWEDPNTYRLEPGVDSLEASPSQIDALLTLLGPAEVLRRLAAKQAEEGGEA
jgi:hypothetical protein